MVIALIIISLLIIRILDELGEKYLNIALYIDCTFILIDFIIFLFQISGVKGSPFLNFLYDNYLVQSSMIVIFNLAFISYFQVKRNLNNNRAAVSSAKVQDKVKSHVPLHWRAVNLKFDEGKFGIDDEKEWNQFATDKNKALEVLKNIKGAYAFSYIPNITTDKNQEIRNDVMNNISDFFVIKDGEIITESLAFQFKKEKDYILSTLDLSLYLNDLLDYVEEKYGIPQLIFIKPIAENKTYDKFINDISELKDKTKGKVVVFSKESFMNFDVYDNAELQENTILNEFNEYLISQGSLAQGDSIENCKNEFLRKRFKTWLNIYYPEYKIIQLKS